MIGSWKLGVGNPLGVAELGVGVDDVCTEKAPALRKKAGALLFSRG